MHTKGKVEMHGKELNVLSSNLRYYGMKSQVMPITASPFDLLVEGVARVELKTARHPQLGPDSDLIQWKYNLHRHGIKTKGEVDFFVFVIPPMKAIGMAYSLYLVVPAKIIEDKFTFLVSYRTLLTKYSQYVNKWSLIKDFCTAKNGAQKP